MAKAEPAWEPSGVVATRLPTTPNSPLSVRESPTPRAGRESDITVDWGEMAAPKLRRERCDSQATVDWSRVAVKTEDAAQKKRRGPPKSRPSLPRKSLKRRASMLRRSLVRRKEPLAKKPTLPTKEEPFAIRHFTYQVALVRRLFPDGRQWMRFFGALGTGILGVRPKNPSEADKPLAGSHIVLFLNAASAHLQDWGGRTMGGHTAKLDTRACSLLWESQRHDQKGKVIRQIVDFVGKGSDVVVAVRSGPGAEFKILGRTRDFALEAEARFLVKEGDHVLSESGSNRVHRCILPQCLDGGLKSGVGLLQHTYPPRRVMCPQYCSACCWCPALARLSFSEMDPDAAKLLAPIVTRRLRGKQPVGGALLRPKLEPVKRELESAAVEEEGRRVRRRWRKSLAARWRAASSLAALAMQLPPPPPPPPPPPVDPLLLERNTLMARLTELDWQLALRTVQARA